MKIRFLACLLFGLFTFGGSAWAQEKPAPAPARPQLVTVILRIVDLVPQKGTDGKPGAAKNDFDVKDLTGPEENVIERLKTLMSAGQTIGTRTIGFTAVEHQQMVVGNQESKFYLRSVQRTATGKLTSTMTARPTGMLAKAIVKVMDDKAVAIDIDFQETRFYPPDVGARKGGRGKEIYVYGARPVVDVGVAAVKDDDGKELQVYEFMTHSLKTKVKVPLGEAVVAQGIQTTFLMADDTKVQKDGQAQIMMIVSARIHQPR